MSDKKPDTRTRGQRARAVRQEELRRYISEQRHEQQVVDNIEKLEDVSGKHNPQNAGMEQTEIARIKAATEYRLKLMNKYIPDLKSIELGNDPDNPLTNADDATLDGRLRALIDAAAKPKG